MDQLDCSPPRPVNGPTTTRRSLRSVDFDGDETLSSASKRVASEFAQTTTAHGYQRLVMSSRARRIAWIVVVVVSSCGLAFHMSMLLNRFLAGDTSTAIENRIEEVTFPHVVICATRLWSDLAEKHEASNYLKRLRKKIRLAVTPYMENKRDNDVSMFVSEVLRESMIDNHFPRLRQFVVHKENIILYCRYNMHECGPQNFTLVSYGREGACYKFNDKNENTRAHYYGGLFLLVHVEDTHWGDLLSYHLKTTKGVLIYTITRNSNFNINRLLPLGAPTGQVTNVGISFSRMIRTPTSQRTCATTMKVYDPLMKVNKTNRYTFIDCVDKEMNLEVYRKCKCVSSSLIIDASLSNAHFCKDIHVVDDDNGTFAISNIEELVKNYDCESWMLAKLDQESRRFQAVCPRSCVRENVHLETSSTAIPSEIPMQREYFEEVVRAHRRNKLKAKFNTIRWLLNANETNFASSSIIHQNLLQLHVHVRTQEVVSYREHIAFPLISFLSEAGGVMGLWVGASIITLFEVIEMILLLSRALVRSANSGNRLPNGAMRRNSQERGRKLML